MSLLESGVQWQSEILHLVGCTETHLWLLNMCFDALNEINYFTDRVSGSAKLFLSQK